MFLASYEKDFSMTVTMIGKRLRVMTRATVRVRVRLWLGRDG